MLQLQLTDSVPSPKRGLKQSGDSYAETDNENDDDDPDSDADADADANVGHSEPVPGQDSDGDTDTTSRSLLLPPSASTFFSFYEHECVFSSSELQSVLHVRATELNFSAAVNHVMKSGDDLTAALLVSNAAPYASDWKQALPNSRDTTYSDAWFHTQCVIHWELQNQHCLQLVQSITMQMEIATSKILLMLCLVTDIRSKASHSDMMEPCRY